MWSLQSQSEEYRVFPLHIIFSHGKSSLLSEEIFSASSISCRRVFTASPPVFSQDLSWKRFHGPLRGDHNLGELRQIFKTKHSQCWYKRRSYPWGTKGRQTLDFHITRCSQLAHKHVQYSLNCPKPLLWWFWLNGLGREWFVCVGKKYLAWMVTAGKLNHEHYCQ